MGPGEGGDEREAALVLPRGAVMHTTKGDITLKLFPEECPKTIENFSTHAKNGYFDGIIFHRVIKGFMVQTGDPLGAPQHFLHHSVDVRPSGMMVSALPAECRLLCAMPSNPPWPGYKECPLPCEEG